MNREAPNHVTRSLKEGWPIHISSNLKGMHLVGIGGLFNSKIGLWSEFCLTRCRRKESGWLMRDRSSRAATKDLPCLLFDQVNLLPEKPVSRRPEVASILLKSEDAGEFMGWISHNFIIV